MVREDEETNIETRTQAHKDIAKFVATYLHGAGYLMTAKVEALTLEHYNELAPNGTITGGSTGGEPPHGSGRWAGNRRVIPSGLRGRRGGD